MKITNISKFLFIFMAATLVFTGTFTAADVLTGNLAVAYASETGEGEDSQPGTPDSEPGEGNGETGENEPGGTDPAPGGDQNGQTDPAGTENGEANPDAEGGEGSGSGEGTDEGSGEQPAGDENEQNEQEQGETDPNQDPSQENTDPNADPENGNENGTGEQGQNGEGGEGSGEDNTGSETEKTDETDPTSGTEPINDNESDPEAQKYTYTLHDEEYSETIKEITDKAIQLQITAEDLEDIIDQLIAAGVDVENDAMVQATIENLNKQIEDLKKEYEEKLKAEQQKPAKVITKTERVYVPSSSPSSSSSSTGRAPVSIPTVSVARTTPTVPTAPVTTALPAAVNTLTTKMADVTSKASGIPIKSTTPSGEATYSGDDDDYGVNTVESLDIATSMPVVETTPLVATVEQTEDNDEFLYNPELTDPDAEMLFAEVYSEDNIEEQDVANETYQAASPMVAKSAVLTKNKSIVMKLGMFVIGFASLALIGLYIFGCRMGFFAFDPAGAFRRLTRKKVKVSALNDMISQTIA